MGKPVLLNKEQKQHLLVTMLESRHGDLREESLNRQGKGHFHVSGRGHEALAAIGVQLQDGDYLAPYYRDRGLCLGRGMTTAELALEYLSKKESSSLGRMMPSHFNSRKLNIVSVPTTTAAQLLPACGIAWGLKLDAKDNAVVATVGDAAARQGDFYEAVSFALEKKLPMLFVVEDNGYGISTPTRTVNPLALEVLNRAQWLSVDGSDVEAVHAAGRQALEKIRARGGPVFIWMKLERLSSHTSSDDHTLYRSKEDLAALVQADPILVLKDRMIRSGELTEAAFEELDAAIKEKVREQYADAEKAENPSEADLMTEVTGPLPELDEELFPAGKYRMGDLINRTLRAGLDSDLGRMIFGEDVEDPKGGVFRLTQKLSVDFPEQVFNSPLAESTIIGVAGGLALYGRRPVFEIQFVDFIHPGFNQLVSNLANLRWRSNGAWKVPAVIYAPYGAYLPGGGPWHSQANESVFAHFPGLHVVVPSTPEDAAGLMWSAMHAEDIVLVLLPKHLLWAEHEVASPVVSIPLGKARQCLEGDDVTIVAWGNTVEKSLEAVAELHGEVGVDLIDLRSIAPWDKASVEASVRKTGRLIIVQEDTENCSVGQMIITHITSHPELWSALKAPPVLVSKGNVMIGYNPIHEYAALPDTARIVDTIWRTVSIDTPRAGGSSVAKSAPIESVAKPPAANPANSHAENSPAGSGNISITVPAMGEGLRTGRVVALNKQPGDVVKVDDVLCEVETDKAVYPIEASFAGRFKEWKIKIDDTVLIGQEIAVVAHDDRIESLSSTVDQKAPVTSSVVSKFASVAPTLSSQATSNSSGSMKGIVRPPALHPAITKRLASVVPATMLRDVRWDALRAAREEAKKRHGKAAASPSAMMAWCVVRAQEKHASFRCLVNKDGTILEQADFDFGVAVALDGDRLATAPITAANKLSWPDFVTAYNRAVDETRAGKLIDVQAPVNITSLGAFGIESATPIVVPPSMGTLFVGSAHERLYNENGVIHPVEVITLSLTFDHKVVNGGGAAAFLYEIKNQMESYKLPE